MGNNLEIFENDEFGEIRVMDIDGEPWFVAVDICKALEIGNPSMAVNRLDNDEKMTLNSTEGHSGQRGGAQSMNVVNESGLYAIVLGSRKPEAKAFKRWVTHEVIPSIRKHGAYLTDSKIDEILSDPDTIIKLATQLKEERQQRKAMQEQIIQQKPLVEFADTVSKASNTIDMNEMAKLLSKEDVKIGRNRLFEFLRQCGVLMKNNTPYQYYIDNEYFKVVEVVKGNLAFTKTMVTGKGQIFITEKLRHEFASC